MKELITDTELTNRFLQLCKESVTVNEFYQKDKSIPIKTLIDNWKYTNKIMLCKFLNVVESKNIKNVYFDKFYDDNSTLIKKELTLI